MLTPNLELAKDRNELTSGEVVLLQNQNTSHPACCSLPPQHTDMYTQIYNNISNHIQKDLIFKTKKASTVPGVSLFSQVLSNNIWLKFSMLQGSQASFPDISVLSLWVKETYFWLFVRLPTTLYYQTTMLKAGMHTLALISTENHNSFLLLSLLLPSPLGDRWLCRSHPSLHFDLLFTSSIFFLCPGQFQFG